MRQILTATRVKSLYSKDEPSMTADGGGLYFRKRKKTASSVVRKTKSGVASFETVGRYPELSLSAACDELRKFGNGGADGTSVAELFEEWFDHNEREWRRPEQMRGYIRRLAAEDPHLMTTNIKSIDLMTVRKFLKRYAKNHGNVATIPVLTSTVHN